MGLILTVQKKIEINASGEGWLQSDTVLPDPLVRGMWYFASAGTYDQIGLTLPEGKVYIVAYDGFTWDYGDLLGLISWNVLLNKPTSKATLGISELATLTEVAKLISDALLGLNIPTFTTPDWNATSGQSGFIANKPTIPNSPVNGDWISTSGLSKILNKPTSKATLGISELATLTEVAAAIQAAINNLNYVAPKQPNWAQNDGTQIDYIKNKPSIPQDPQQANWDETDQNSLSYIKNKPELGFTQVPADWNAASGQANSIANKPTSIQGFGITDAYTKDGTDNAIDEKIAEIKLPEFKQEHADWEEENADNPGYIANKPTIPSAQQQTDWNSQNGITAIANKPTTRDGFGLTDVFTKDETADAIKEKVSEIPVPEYKQQQSDWNETDQDNPGFIKNKPDSLDQKEYDSSSDSIVIPDKAILMYLIVRDSSEPHLEIEGIFNSDDFGWSDGEIIANVGFYNHNNASYSISGSTENTFIKTFILS